MSDDHGHGHAPPPPSSGPLGKPELLTMFGFVKPDYADQWNREFKPLSEAQRRKKVRELGAKAIEMAHQERIEVVDEQFDVSGFPGGAARLHLVLESATENVEDSYFMILELARHAWGLPLVYKTSDYFAATENSAFFGNSQQRIGIQQDRVQQFLANIGKFVKELFQMVRELRIIDERLTIYEAAGNLPANPYKKKDEHDHAGAGTGHGHSKSPAQRSHAADVTLKSYFTDLAEGGSKNPQSVFGLAQQVNFTLLPDLFFNEYIGKKEDVDATVERMQYNKSLKAVLKRKLYQYLVWKEKTYMELVHRRQFNVRYLRQHWTIIKMYMAWVKPYLRNIQRMTMNQDFFDSPDMIAAFETAMMEVEFIATSDPHDYDGYHPIVLASFQFRTRPDMSVRKEYQQGPVHLGKMDLSVRAYAWTPEQLSAYRAMKRREEIELLSVLDTSLRDIMDSLGEDFEVYLKEVGEEVDEKPKPVVLKKEQPGALAPFMGVAFGLKELVSGLNPLPSKPKDDHGHGHGKLGKPGKAMSVASFKAGQIYHVFKKQKRLVTW